MNTPTHSLNNHLQELTDTSKEFQQFMYDRYGTEDEDYVLRLDYQTSEFAVFSIPTTTFNDIIVYFKESGTWIYGN